MSAQKGKDLLIKLGKSASGASTLTYTTVAGLRTTRIAFNAETVDVTNADSANRWRELLAGAGVRAARLSGSGVFKDHSTDEEMRSAFFNGEHLECQFLLPDFGTITGKFQITSLDYAGTHDGEMTVEIDFASAGSLSFTPAATAS